MPNIFKLLSPMSILIGVLAAVGGVALLWPVPREVIAPLALLTMIVASALAEIVGRLFRRKREE